MNYEDTFIAVAEDCRASQGAVPALKGGRETVAVAQYRMLANHPYQFTQEDVLFETSTIARDKPNLTPAEKAELRREFFAKSQACLRASPLAKSYGWGFHFDGKGRTAIVGVETEEYTRLKADRSLAQTRAMRSKRA